MQIDRALIIQEPWISYILSGEKTWEMRTSGTSIRGPIALFRKGCGQIVGLAELVDSLEPLNNIADKEASFEFHRIKDVKLIEKWNNPWVLSNVKKLPKAIPLKPKPGAVIWTKLDAQAMEAIAAVMATKS